MNTNNVTHVAPKFIKFNKENIELGAKYINTKCPGIVYLGCANLDLITNRVRNKQLIIISTTDMAAARIGMIVAPIEKCSDKFWDCFIKITVL